MLTLYFEQLPFQSSQTLKCISLAVLVFPL